METGFAYRQHGYHIDYKGLGFDSLLELRYAISIEDDYAFLRDGIKIFYDPLTRKSTNYVREGIQKYTPDFLIRNWQTGKALLVEIKPFGFDDFDKLSLYQNASAHFIQTNNFDWEYRVIFEQDIVLSTAQQEKYDAVLANKILYRKYYGCYSLDHRKYNGQYMRSNLLSANLPPAEYVLFVKRNKLPLHIRY